MCNDSNLLYFVQIVKQLFHLLSVCMWEEPLDEVNLEETTGKERVVDIVKLYFIHPQFDGKMEEELQRGYEIELVNQKG